MRAPGSKIEMMRLFLISLILFSHLFVFPLVKKYILFAKSEKTFIRVSKGENISTIADKYNVSIDDIIEWNHIANPDKLVRGQKLVIFKNSKKSSRLEPGQEILLHLPVSKWQVIKGYIPYGDSKNPGLLCKVEGDPAISAANSGRIVKISQMRGYGKYILIDHGNGWHSMYSNLDNVKVKSGQYVNLSETIGIAKNNKIFFLLAYNGKPVNPAGYFMKTARNV